MLFTSRDMVSGARSVLRTSGLDSRVLVLEEVVGREVLTDSRPESLLDWRLDPRLISRLTSLLVSLPTSRLDSRFDIRLDWLLWLSALLLWLAELFWRVPEPELRVT